MYGGISGQADAERSPSDDKPSISPSLRAAPWGRTLALWSLLAMIKTYAHELADIASQLGTHPIALAGLHLGGTEKVPDFYFAEIRRLLEAAKPLCAELGMSASLIQVNRLLNDLPHHDTQGLAMAVKETHGRIIDELSAVHFFHVPANKVEFYDKPWFGESVEDRFHKAVDDMREATKCFALGRYSGVVLHCMGIVQAGLEELAKDLRVKIDIQVDDWNNIITKIEGGRDRKKKKTLGSGIPTTRQKSRWAKLEPFYSDVIGEVRAMKNAWRNPGFHFRRRDFDEPKAREVLDRIKDFMRNLAVNLPMRTR